MRTGHGENVRSLINQCSGQRLAAESTYLCAFLCTDFYRVQAWRLAANRVHAGGCDFDVPPVANHAAKEPFRDWAPANVACADEEDVFHGSERAANAFIKLEANLSKSISDGPRASFSSDLSLLAAAHCGYCDHRSQ
jgi:hypothetical protein